MARLYLTRHGPFLANLVFINEKAWGSGLKGLYLLNLVVLFHLFVLQLLLSLHSISVNHPHNALDLILNKLVIK